MGLVEFLRMGVMLLRPMIVMRLNMPSAFLRHMVGSHLVYGHWQRWCSRKTPPVYFANGLDFLRCSASAWRV